MNQTVIETIEAHKAALLEFEKTGIQTVEDIAGMIIDSLNNGGRIYLCGNGGSAADCQHIAGEFIGRFRRERNPLPAVAFSTDTSVITCIGNDYSFDDIFTRQVEALVGEGDILWAFSTSGTSANVVNVVNSLTEDEVFMAPDRNLAQYAAHHTSKKIHFWDGYCPIHDRLSPKDIEAAKAAHPEAVFMAHPECRPEILEMADKVSSTSGMLVFAKESRHTEFIVGTENGLLYPLKKASPDKTFYPASEEMICPDMKRITPEMIAACLENMSPEVKVSEDIQQKALGAVEKMLALR